MRQRHTNVLSTVYRLLFSFCQINVLCLICTVRCYDMLFEIGHIFQTVYVSYFFVEEVVVVAYLLILYIFVQVVVRFPVQPFIYKQ